MLSPEEMLCAPSQCGQSCLDSTSLCLAAEGDGANLESLEVPRLLGNLVQGDVSAAAKQSHL